MDLENVIEELEHSFTDLGAVTAYAIAVKHGYQGTEEEWIAEISKPREEQINKWFIEHPEATTTVQDGAISFSKLTADVIAKTVKDYVSPEMFTNSRDYSADFTTALNAAADYARTHDTLLYVPKNNYKCSTNVNFRGIKRVRVDGVLSMTEDDAWVIVGDSSQSGAFCDIHIGGATRVKVMGLLDSSVYVGWSRHLFLYADGDVKADNAIAYNTFRGEYISKVEINSNKETTVVGWINDNIFDIRRIANIIIDGNYKHNNNHFRNCSLEGGAASVEILQGHSNSITCRGESLPINNIIIGEGCFNNRILKSWGSSGLTAGLVDKVVEISKSNYYGMVWDELRDFHNIIYIDKNNKSFTGMQGYLTANGKLYAYSGQTHAHCEKYMLPKASEVEIVMSASDRLFGLKSIVLYDENMQAITLSADVAEGGGINAFYGQTTANLNAGGYNLLTFKIKDTSIARFISFDLITVSGYNGEFEYVNVKFGINKLFSFTPIPSPMEIKSKTTAAPNRGVWEKGEIVYNSNPTSGGYLGWICVEGGTPGTWKGFGLIA